MSFTYVGYYATHVMDLYTGRKVHDTHSTHIIVQELCDSRGGRPGLSVLTNLLVSVDVKHVEPCFGIDLSLSLICQPTSEDIKHRFIIIIRRTHRVQELCESRGGRPGLSVLMSLTVSEDVKQH